MLSLAKAAGHHLEPLLTEANVPQGAFIRIAILPDSVSSLTLSEEEPGGTRLEHQSKTVLLLGKRAADGFAERTLDAEGSRKKGRLAFRRLVKRTNACGPVPPSEPRASANNLHGGNESAGGGRPWLF